MAVYIFTCQYLKVAGTKTKLDAEGKPLIGSDGKEKTEIVYEGIEFALNQNIALGATALTIITIAVIIFSLEGLQRKPGVNYVLGYLFSTSLTYVIGYCVATKDKNVVLTAFILTFALSLMCTFFAGRII